MCRPFAFSWPPTIAAARGALIPRSGSCRMFKRGATRYFHSPCSRCSPRVPRILHEDWSRLKVAPFPAMRGCMSSSPMACPRRWSGNGPLADATRVARIQVYHLARVVTAYSISWATFRSSSWTTSMFGSSGALPSMPMPTNFECLSHTTRTSCRVRTCGVLRLAFDVWKSEVPPNSWRTSAKILGAKWSAAAG